MDYLTAETVIDGAISYDTPEGVRRACRRYMYLTVLAERGSQTALCTVIDLQLALGCLPPGQRAAVVGVLILHRSIRKVAEELGLKEDAVRMRVRRALKRMSNYLTRGPYGADGYGAND